MKKVSLLASILAVLLTGCGGSSSSDSDNSGGDDNGGGNNTVSTTGQFLDSAVQGVDFVTASKSGVTNLSGTFPYNVGEKVTFSIGDLVFPTVTANKFITPLELAETTNPKDPEVINMVRLLMTLDADGNPDNGITISSQAKLTAVPLNFNVSVDEFASSQDVLDFISNAGQQTQVTELVTRAEAEAHFQKTLDDIEALDTYADFVGMFNIEENVGDDGYTGIFNIYSDGSYLLIDFYNYEDSAEDTGFEYGHLNMDENNTVIPSISIQTNGENDGFDSGVFTNVHIDDDNYYMTKEPTEGEDGYTLIFPRVTITGKSIIGSWETQNQDASYNFRNDGRYYFAQIKDQDAEQGGGNIGIEVGSYQFDDSTSILNLDISQGIDTSGPTLLANNGESYDINSAVLSEDGQTLTLMVDYNDGEDTQLILNRVL